MKSSGASDEIPPYVVEFGGTLRSLTTHGMNWLRRRMKEVQNILMLSKASQAYKTHCWFYRWLKEKLKYIDAKRI